MIPKEQKFCQYCKSILDDGVVKCKHCGEFVDEKFRWNGEVVKPKRFSKVFCTSCGHIGKPKVKAKGSLVIEVFLWCMFIIPGLFYTLRRESTRYCVCKKCGSNRVNRK